ncbi:glycosyltransferase family 2 protein [Cloacibacillus evryensis]|uniref:glycosyltransferase family 2 protein n=1 Tax=Cloacibacillus evryensis TaxID=508460 RepID=UPI00241CB1BA|nr:glycosyltransferase family 2 protein [Cloacibacillus evryensis]
MHINITPELSICITSYNRANELLRCLKSIDCKFPEKIEVIISEDCSPQRKSIVEKVNQYKVDAPYDVHLNLNEFNLGYDGNLARLISLASGKYVLLMSDDDLFISGAIDKTMAFLERHECGILFSPFQIGIELKRKYGKSARIEPNIKNAAEHIYDAILFSGLIFKREYVKNISGDRFAKLNYFQVFLFLSVLSRYVGYYLDVPLIDCIGDGENAYGIAESNDKNPYLADRKSIFSNLEFHKGLIKVIQLFESDNNVPVVPIFSKEYSLRSYSGLSLARRKGRKEYREYWKRLNSLELQLSFIVYIYYSILYLVGADLSDTIFYIPKKFIYLIRGNKCL